MNRLLLATVFAAAAAHAVEPPPGRVIVPPTPEFPRNGEGSMVTLKNGDILMLYGAQTGTRDWALGVIREIRSPDAGRTWSEPRTVLSDPERSLFQPSLARLPDGTLGLTHTSLLPGRGAFKLFRRSDDEGRTWSDPIRISDDARPHTTGSHDRLYVLSSGRVITLVHCYLKEDIRMQGGLHAAYAIYSDDSGRTWSRPPRDADLSVPDNPQDRSEWGFWEASLAETAPGKLLMLGRTATGFLWETRSEDAGETWGRLTRTDLPHPLAPPVLTKAPNSDVLVLLHNPDVDPKARMGGLRTRLVYRTSRDAGRTWSEPSVIVESSDGKLWYDYPAVLWIHGNLHIACRRIELENGRLSTVGMYYTVLPQAIWATAKQ
jgi:Neuraminidase (sialidase)